MNVKRKILFVNSSVSGGGAGKALIYLLRALQKDQVQSFVVVPSDGVVGQLFREAGAKLDYIPTLPERFGKTQFQMPSIIRWQWLQSFINILMMPYFAWKVAKVAKKQQVDLICSNHQILVPICVMAGYFSGIPVAIYSREYLEEFKAKFFFKWVASLRVVKKVFSVSKVSGELYNGMDKLQLLYDCYDFNDFGGALPQANFRAQYNIPKDMFVYGFMGRIIERKGVDFLIRAFAQVHQRHPNTHLAIIGGNDPGLPYNLVDRYKQLAFELGVEKSVTFTGFVKDVRTMTSDFDVCVMPSLNPEPFGLVYLEAVICKVPCIVPDNSGAAEVVINGQNGKLFKAKNVDSLEQAMSDSYVEREKRKSITDYAYDNIKALFDTHEQSSNITNAFLKAANGKEM